MKKIIGQIIEERFKASKMSAVDFAKAISKERSNVYNIFKRESIDTDLLKKIGQVLDYDFFIHFIEPKTIEKIKMSESVKKAKILIELEFDEEEIANMGFDEKVIKILTKKK